MSAVVSPVTVPFTAALTVGLPVIDAFDKLGKEVATGLAGGLIGAAAGGFLGAERGLRG